MPSDEHVRRLARELVLPDEADLVIQKPKYWNAEFCRLYFRRCDELLSEAPQDGLVAAEVCPELAYLTQRATGQPQDRLRLRALAVLGSGYRATDDLDQAEETYQEALKLLRAKRASIPESDIANVLFRLAVLRSFQNQYEIAAKLASQSVGIYREAPAHVRRRHLGEALTVRGYIHHMNGHLALAMKDWGEAVVCTNVKQAPRIFYAVVHNLALGIAESVVLPRDLSTVERYVTQASRYFSRKSLSVPKLKVLWLRGMIMMRFGSTRRGEATYRKVISGFLKLGKIVDVALVSVALGRHLHQERRLDELQVLAIETHGVCERLCRYDDIKCAVSIWKEAVVASTISADVFASTWQVLEKNSFQNATVPAMDMSTALRISSVTPKRGIVHGQH